MQAGCALVGGETAEHPGVMRPDEYDISGTGVGVVNADAVLGPERVRPGDVLVAMGRPGVHSNGYSLVRHVLLERGGLGLDAAPELLDGAPWATNCSPRPGSTPWTAWPSPRECGARAFAHITGGGLAGNLARVLPAGSGAVVDRATWAPQPIFELVAATGEVRGPTWS